MNGRDDPVHSETVNRTHNRDPLLPPSALRITHPLRRKHHHPIAQLLLLSSPPTRTNTNHHFLHQLSPVTVVLLNSAVQHIFCTATWSLERVPMDKYALQVEVNRKDTPHAQASERSLLANASCFEMTQSTLQSCKKK